jgi:replicative DNA helicase
VSLDVWDQVEDMREALRKIQQEGSDTKRSDDEEEES